MCLLDHYRLLDTRHLNDKAVGMSCHSVQTLNAVGFVVIACALGQMSVFCGLREATVSNRRRVVVVVNLA